MKKKFQNLAAGAITALTMLSGCADDFDAPHSPLNYPDSGTDSARLYVEKCGSCHAAPLPGIHVASHWPGIVLRMQQRMTSKAVAPLNKNEVAIIVDYLQKHAPEKNAQ